MLIVLRSFIVQQIVLLWWARITWTEFFIQICSHGKWAEGQEWREPVSDRWFSWQKAAKKKRYKAVTEAVLYKVQSYNVHITVFFFSWEYSYILILQWYLMGPKSTFGQIAFCCMRQTSKLSYFVFHRQRSVIQEHLRSCKLNEWVNGIIFTKGELSLQMSSFAWVMAFFLSFFL